MKELFIYRIKQAEKPSKKEKYIRKVMMWIVADIVSIAFASSLFMQALEPEHYEITRWDARKGEGHNRIGFTPETIPQTNDTLVHEEGGKVTPADPLEIIKKVAKEEGIDWKVIYAICKKETGCNPNIDCSRQGGHCDNYTSFGAYQIHRPAHPDIAVRDMEDFEWSTRWTAQRIKTKSDKWGVDLAIALHNGNPQLPQVKRYLAEVKSIIESL